MIRAILFDWLLRQARMARYLINNRCHFCVLSQVLKMVDLEVDFNGRVAV